MDYRFSLRLAFLKERMAWMREMAEADMFYLWLPGSRERRAVPVALL